MEDNYQEFLLRIHQKVQERVKQNNHGRNYIRLFRPYNPHQVNIIGTFEDAIMAENGNAPMFDTNSRKAFGMVSSEQFFTYEQLALQPNSPFSDLRYFQAYINKHYRNFCIDSEECTRAPEASAKTWQKAFFARCILAASQAFCFALHFIQQEDIVPVLTILRKDGACRVAMDKDDKKLLLLYGRPLEKSLLALQNVKILKQENQLLVTSGDSGDTFLQLYTEKYAAFYKCREHALYSGTIPRLLAVAHESPSISNMDIEKLLLHTGRTSYLTIYGMRNTTLLNHPFMQQCIEEGHNLAWWNQVFDEKEVAVQEIYFTKMREVIGDFAAEVKTLNEYLAHSWNVHNINVSGNLITADNYCIYTKRGNYIEDAGNYYCSVNGGCEIKDDGVDFYMASVEEDIPTIFYEKSPYYFGGELTREAVAELGIIDASRTWKYHGITVMGHYENTMDTHRIWLHFNVLGVRNCTDTFDKIMEQKKQATENFESNALMGYCLRLFSTQKARAIHYGKEILAFISGQKDMLMLLMLFIACTVTGKAFFDFNTVLSTFFVVIMAIILIGEVFTHWQQKKHKTTINVVANKSHIPYDWYCKLFSGEKAKRIDAVLLYLMELRIEQIFYQ